MKKQLILIFAILAIASTAWGDAFDPQSGALASTQYQIIEDSTGNRVKLPVIVQTQYASNFGVVCDGSTDDATALQSALDWWDAGSFRKLVVQGPSACKLSSSVAADIEANRGNVLIFLSPIRPDDGVGTAVEIADAKDITLQLYVDGGGGSWTDAGTPTYSDSDTFTVTGDQTTAFATGTPVKVTDDGTDYYAEVVSSSYSTETTVNISKTVLTANLTAASYGVDYRTADPTGAEQAFLVRGVRGGNIGVTGYNYDGRVLRISKEGVGEEKTSRLNIPYISTGETGARCGQAFYIDGSTALGRIGAISSFYDVFGPYVYETSDIIIESMESLWNGVSGFIGEGVYSLWVDSMSVGDETRAVDLVEFKASSTPTYSGNITIDNLFTNLGATGLKVVDVGGNASIPGIVVNSYMSRDNGDYGLYIEDSRGIYVNMDSVNDDKSIEIAGTGTNKNIYAVIRSLGANKEAVTVGGDAYQIRMSGFIQNANNDANATTSAVEVTSIGRDIQFDFAVEGSGIDYIYEIPATNGVKLIGGDITSATSTTSDFSNAPETAIAVDGYAGSSLLTSADINTSSELAGILDDETGTGAAVFASSPDLQEDVEILGSYPSLALDHSNDGDYGRLQATADSLKVDMNVASGAAYIYYDPEPGDGTSTASVRYFRDTNTTGATVFEVYKGDGTSTRNILLSGNGDTKLAEDSGNVMIGSGGTPTSKLEVDGDIEFNADTDSLCSAGTSNCATGADIIAAANGRIWANPTALNTDSATTELTVNSTYYISTGATGTTDNQTVQLPVPTQGDTIEFIVGGDGPVEVDTVSSSVTFWVNGGSYSDTTGFTLNNFYDFRCHALGNTVWACQTADTGP